MRYRILIRNQNSYHHNLPIHQTNQLPLYLYLPKYSVQFSSVQFWLTHLVSFFWLTRFGRFHSIVFIIVFACKNNDFDFDFFFLFLFRIKCANQSNNVLMVSSLSVFFIFCVGFPALMFMQDERNFQNTSDAQLETRCQNIQTDKSYMQDNMTPLEVEQNIQTEKSYLQDALPPVQDKQVFTIENECTICSQIDEAKKKQSSQEKTSPRQEEVACQVEEVACPVEEPSCQLSQDLECFQCEYKIPQRWDGIRYPTQYGVRDGGETSSRIRHFNPPMKAAFSSTLPKIDRNNPPFRKSYICVSAPKCPEVASLLSYEQLACMCDAPPPTPESANNLGLSISLPNVSDSCECSETIDFFSTHSGEEPCASKVVASSTDKSKENTPCELPSMVSPKPVCCAPKLAIPTPFSPPMPLSPAKPPMPPYQVVSKTNKICPCCKQKVPELSRTCGVASKSTIKRNENKSCICALCSDEKPCTCVTEYNSLISNVDEKSCTCAAQSNYHSLDSEGDDKCCTCGAASKTNYKSANLNKDREKSCTSRAASKAIMSRVYSEIKLSTCGGMSKAIVIDGKSCTCGVPSITNTKDDDKSCTCGVPSITKTKSINTKDDDKSCTCGVPSKSNYESIYTDKDDDKSCTCGTLPKTYSVKDEDKSCTCGTVSKTKDKSMHSNKDDSCSCGPVSKVIMKSITDIKSGTCGPSSKVIWNSVCFEKTPCTSRAPSIANRSASCPAQNRKSSICSEVLDVSDMFKNCVEASFKEDKSTSIYESAEDSSTNCCVEKKATPLTTSNVCTSLHPEVRSFYICKENGARKQSPFSIKKKSSCNDDVRSTKKRKQNGSSFNPRKSKTRKSMQCSTRTSSRSRSVMAEVTCLCTSTDRVMLGATNRKGPPFARVLKNGLSITPVSPCLLSLADERNSRASVIWKGDNFCDCLSASTDSDPEFGVQSNFTVGGTQERKSKMSVVKKVFSCLPKPTVIGCENDVSFVADLSKAADDVKVSVKQMLSRLKAPKIIESCYNKNEEMAEMTCDCCPQNDETDDGCTCEPQDGCQCEQKDCFKAESHGECECPTEQSERDCTCKASLSRSDVPSCFGESNKPDGSCPCIASVSQTSASAAKDVFKSCILDRGNPSKATVSQSATRCEFKSCIANVKSAVSCQSCTVCPVDRKMYSLRIDESANKQVVCPYKSQVACKREPQLDNDGEPQVECTVCEAQLVCECKSEPQITRKREPLDECTCKSEAELRTESDNKTGCNCAKQRIVNMLDIISDKCDTTTDRTVVFQQIIKELTDMLRDAEKSVDDPCLSVEDCMKAVGSGRSPAKEANARKERSNQGLTKEYLDRIEKCQNECFPSKKSGRGYEIVAFEFDPKLLAERAAAEAAAKAAGIAACEAEAAALAAAQVISSCECGQVERMEPSPPPTPGNCSCGVQAIESAVFLDCECQEESDSNANLACVQNPESKVNLPCGKESNTQACPPCTEEPDNQVCRPIVEGCEKDFQDVCGPLTDRERQLCDYLICRMCQICQGQADQDECPGTSNNTDAEKEAQKSCLCCHCCAMQCDNQCSTVKKVLDPIVCDPVAEMVSNSCCLFIVCIR